MTFGEKLKEIRKRFGLSQEQLGELIHVSRQAITKWESDRGMPDISNLQELSYTFGVSIDYFLNNDSAFPLLVLRKELDKTQYKNKISSYQSILQEYFCEPWEVYSLIRLAKLTKLEWVLDILTGGYLYSSIKDISDLSPYYLVIKDDLKLLVNIKNWVLEVHELPADINTKKFIVGDNRFSKMAKINLKK